jgi:hypothetical protein
MNSIFHSFSITWFSFCEIFRKGEVANQHLLSFIRYIKVFVSLMEIHVDNTSPLLFLYLLHVHLRNYWSFYIILIKTDNFLVPFLRSHEIASEHCNNILTQHQQLNNFNQQILNLLQSENGKNFFLIPTFTLLMSLVDLFELWRISSSRNERKIHFRKFYAHILRWIAKDSRRISKFCYSTSSTGRRSLSSGYYQSENTQHSSWSLLGNSTQKFSL